MPCCSCKSADGRRSCVRCACANAGRPCCDCYPPRSSRCANCNDDGVSGIQPVPQSRFVERLSAPEGTTTTPDLTQRSYGSVVSAFASSPTLAGSNRLLRELPDSQLSSRQWRLFIKNGDWLTGIWGGGHKGAVKKYCTNSHSHGCCRVGAIFFHRPLGTLAHPRPGRAEADQCKSSEFLHKLRISVSRAF